MTEDPAPLDPTPAPIPEAADGSHPASGSTSVWMVVALALSFLGLVAMAALMAAPAGGCGGG
jgi:ABC-type Na+ efflux pump permease subunit